MEKNLGKGSSTYPKLNPDPAGHLILAPVGQGYLYENVTMSAKGQGNHWIFPHCKTLRMDHSQPFRVLGIKFHIGALYSLNIASKQPTLDEVISADADLHNYQIHKQLVKLDELSDSAQRCCDMLDDLLIAWLSACHEDKHSQLVRGALPLLIDTPVSAMGAAVHCSQRTIERSFLRVTGLTLKQCQSMNRLEAMLVHLYQLEDDNIDWHDVAYRFGFSDQAHLIRYLKTNIGATPARYAKQRDLAIDVYGDFE